MKKKYSIIDKITKATDDTYVIFFYKDRSIPELNFLRNAGLNYKGYDISKLDDEYNTLRTVLNNNATNLNFIDNPQNTTYTFFHGKYIQNFFDHQTNQSIISSITNAPSNTFIIFYIEGCPFCNKARHILKKNTIYNEYDISKFSGGFEKLLELLQQNHLLLKYNISHKTKPIIFYNNIFFGGYSELKKLYPNN